MLTVNSSLRLMNSFVPSSGSTSQNVVPTSGMRPAATSSSATIGMVGASVRSAARMNASARSSASVTGEASPLGRAVKSLR